jgi:hypothetical protein
MQLIDAMQQSAISGAECTAGASGAIQFFHWRGNDVAGRGQIFVVVSNVSGTG